MPAIERSRLTFALDSVDRLQTLFPWATTTETCVLLIAPTVQWVVNCRLAPSGMRPLAEGLRGLPVYEARAETIRYGDERVPVAKLVSVLPATADVPGLGGGASTLGPEAPWIIVSSLDALIAFHPAFPEGTHSEEWLAVFVHEFFHTRQLAQPGLAAVLPRLKSGQLDPNVLTKRFVEDESYQSLVRQEYEWLAGAAARGTALGQLEAKATLREWSAMYAKRRAALGDPALMDTDEVFTYIEGTARYVESQFLARPELRARETLSEDPRFNGFVEYSGKGYEGLFNRDLSRAYFYSLGMHLALVLDRAEPGWTRRVSDERGWIVGMAQAVAGR
ncbi:MAG: hypothetical protein ABW217_01315 [Polyangiaceae bacterium]